MVLFADTYYFHPVCARMRVTKVKKGDVVVSGTAADRVGWLASGTVALGLACAWL